MTNGKILVVDDSRMVRQHVQRTLTAAGFLVSEAADGVEALEKLESEPDTKLVVCDVNMPKMNGLEFLERLRSMNSSIPVVMLTTEGEPGLIRRAKALGAKGWIVKPFKAELLVAAAEKATA